MKPETAPNKCVVCGGPFQQGRFITRRENGLAHPECMEPAPSSSKIPCHGYEVWKNGVRYFVVEKYEQ